MLSTSSVNCNLKVALTLSALLGTLAACGSSNGSGDCAPAGTYLPTAVRSADPGSCPTSVMLDFHPVTVGANEACGPGTSDETGSISGNDVAACSYDGTISGNGSRSGITATGRFTWMCNGQPSCTANFDLTYTRQDGAAGGAP